MNTTNDVQIGFSVKQETANRLYEICKQTKRSRTSIINELIEDKYKEIQQTRGLYVDIKKYLHTNVFVFCMHDSYFISLKRWINRVWGDSMDDIDEQVIGNFIKEQIKVNDYRLHQPTTKKSIVDQEEPIDMIF